MQRWVCRWGEKLKMLVCRVIYVRISDILTTSRSCFCSVFVFCFVFTQREKGCKNIKGVNLEKFVNTPAQNLFDFIGQSGLQIKLFSLYTKISTSHIKINIKKHQNNNKKYKTEGKAGRPKMVSHWQNIITKYKYVTNLDHNIIIYHFHMISLGVPLCLMHTLIPNDKIKHHYVTDCVHEKKHPSVDYILQIWLFELIQNWCLKSKRNWQ